MPLPLKLRAARVRGSRPAAAPPSPRPFSCPSRAHFTHVETEAPKPTRGLQVADKTRSPDHGSTQYPSSYQPESPTASTWAQGSICFPCVDPVPTKLHSHPHRHTSGL